MKPKNARLDVATVTQTANELLGKKETNLYYLVVETDKGKLTINVGEKTYKEINRLTEVVTHIQIAEPEPKQQGGKK